MSTSEPPLPWIEAGQALPAADLAWSQETSAPGLLAASPDLTAVQVAQAYAQGTFPWYSRGQPVLWWSPDPRMVLEPKAFRFHRSLQQSIKKQLQMPGVRLCFDQAFVQVMQRCADSPRQRQTGTWIVPRMIEVYTELHQMGLAHSAELWQDDRLMAGLYFVSLGHAVFGESMFTSVRDGSKMALSLLVSTCLRHKVPVIDCQQNTAHLASLGAQEISRCRFLHIISQAQRESAIPWPEQHLYWDELLNL